MAETVLKVDKLYVYELLIKAHSLYYSASFSSPHYATRHQLYSLPNPFYSTSAGQRTSTFVTSALWNKLPQTLRAIKALSEFKVELRRYIHSGEWVLTFWVVLSTRACVLLALLSRTGPHHHLALVVFFFHCLLNLLFKFPLFFYMWKMLLLIDWWKYTHTHTHTHFKYDKWYSKIHWLVAS